MRDMRLTLEGTPRPPRLCTNIRLSVFLSVVQACDTGSGVERALQCWLGPKGQTFSKSVESIITFSKSKSDSLACCHTGCTVILQFH